MKLPGKNTYDELRMKFGVWNRERKERAAERKAVRDPPTQGAPLAWCYLLTAVGVAALVGSTWMLLVFVAGSVGHVDWFWNYQASEAGVSEDTWSFTSSIHLLVGIGLFLFCLAIAMFNATWLEARRHLSGLIKNVVTGIGVAVGLFMISGAIVVQQRGTDARARDEVVAAQTAAASAGGIEAQIAAIDARLAQMRDRARNNEYAATAANVGAVAYRAQYMNPEVLAREEPARRRIIERALGAAQSADALEAQRMTLAGQLGAARVVTVEAEAIAVRADGFMAAPVAFLEDARKPITATLGELLALTAFSFALAAWMSRRPYAVHTSRSGWAKEEQQIEDKSTPERPGYMSPAEVKRNVVPPDVKYQGPIIYNEKGEELKWWDGFVRPRDGKYIPGHYRPTGKRQKKEIEVTVAGSTFMAGEVAEDAPGDGGFKHAPGVEQAMSGAMVEERESVSATAREEPSDESPADENRYDERSSGPEHHLQSREERPSAGEAHENPEPISQPEPPEPTLTEDQQAELNQSLAALGELEPTPVPEDDQPVPDAVEDEQHEQDALEVIEGEQVADEPVEHDEPQEDERVEPRALLPAK